MVNFKLSNKNYVKRELFNMSCVWDKEKIWVPDMTWPPEHRADALSTELWELMHSFALRNNS